MYESPDQTPLIRLAWNKQVLRERGSQLSNDVQDPNYLATIMQGKESVVILDIRLCALYTVQSVFARVTCSLSECQHSH